MKKTINKEHEKNNIKQITKNKQKQKTFKTKIQKQ